MPLIDFVQFYEDLCDRADEISRRIEEKMRR